MVLVRTEKADVNVELAPMSFIEQNKLTLAPDKGYHGRVARTTLHGQTLWLLQPQTFMNLSGKSVAALARFFKIQPEEILVAHDELDVVPGQAKLKFGGSHAGHNGRHAKQVASRILDGRLLAPADAPLEAF